MYSADRVIIACILSRVGAISYDYNYAQGYVMTSIKVFVIACIY